MGGTFGKFIICKIQTLGHNCLIYTVYGVAQNCEVTKFDANFGVFLCLSRVYFIIASKEPILMDGRMRRLHLEFVFITVLL